MSSKKWHQTLLGLFAASILLEMKVGSCLKSLEDGDAVSIVLEVVTMVGSHYLVGQKLQDCLDDICLEVSASWESSC